MSGYRYIGDPEDRWRGVPGRDLTQDDYDALGPLERRTVTESGAWAVTKPAPSKPNDDKPAGNGGGDD